jgi:biopolymer transport protein ExbD
MNFKRKSRNKLNAISALDLTPMIDVVFNLLIFFAVSLNFVATSGGINVNLPEASSAKPIKTENITINLSKSGKMYFNNEVATKEEIKNKLKEVKDKKSLIIIRADNDVKHGKVVEAMDLAKIEGFSKLAIAVDQIPKPQKQP